MGDPQPPVNSLFKVSDAMVDAAIEAWNATQTCSAPHLICNRFERDQMRAAIAAALNIRNTESA